ncbi:FliM/FliN family flagellar motor switch protein [Ilumatobacter sp.]|uniref:FliM/FliN family flagellar motor switch protein n=1 Tax=Ilumatobacter sp. TaxID=1967498 RepID=UPI003B51739B
MADLSTTPPEPAALADEALVSAARAIADAFGLGDDLEIGGSWPVDGGDRVLVATFAGDEGGELLLAVNAEVATRLTSDPARLARGFQGALDATGAELQLDCDVGEADGRRPRRAVEIRDAGRTCALLATVAAAAAADGDGDDHVESTELDAVVFAGGRPSSERIGEFGGDLLLDVEVQLAVELGRTTMAMRDVLSLRPGQLIEFGRSADAPVDLCVDGLPFALGEVVVVGEQFGVRIVESDADRDRAADLLTRSVG